MATVQFAPSIQTNKHGAEALRQKRHVNDPADKDARGVDDPANKDARAEHNADRGVEQDPQRHLRNP